MAELLRLQCQQIQPPDGFAMRDPCWVCGKPGWRSWFGSHKDILRYFDLPSHVRTMWVSVHNRPAQDRYQVRARILHSSIVLRLVEPRTGRAARHIWICSRRFNPLLKPLVGKKLYLQIEYE
jgi:hypothetical protein